MERESAREFREGGERLGCGFYFSQIESAVTELFDVSSSRIGLL